MLLLPLMSQAQNVLTEQQQLEQAQKQLEAAQKALKAAQIRAEAARLKAQADSIDRANAQAEAAAQKAKADSQKQKEEAAKAAAANKAKEVEPVLPNEEKVSTTGWSVPTAVVKKEEKKPVEKVNGVELKDDPKYLAGAVTTNAQGKVEFTLDTDANGKTAQQIYDIVYKYMADLTLNDNNIGSRVALVNKNEHVIANAMDEWLVFNTSFISLDRTEFKYNLIAEISDNHLHLTLGRIIYNYEEGRSTGFKEPAENVIVDKVALTKKKNGLAKIFGKFRRLTIDRKDQIFNDISYLIKQ